MENDSQIAIPNDKKVSIYCVVTGDKIKDISLNNVASLVAVSPSSNFLVSVAYANNEKSYSIYDLKNDMLVSSHNIG